MAAAEEEAESSREGLEEPISPLSSSRATTKEGTGAVVCSATREPSCGSRSGSRIFERELSGRSLDGGTEAQSQRRRRRFDSRSFVPERENSEISKRYDIDQRIIGQGGYGQVFIARDRMGGDRTVVIKKLIRNSAQRAEVLKREVDIMKDLDHPSICKLFETYAKDNLLFLVIEHLEGGDLYDRINSREHRRLDEDTTAYIIWQTSGALGYAHSRGIAHRDMKPENVCFCSSDPDHNRVKVIDWGLSKHFSAVRMKSSVGTKWFTAPEVLDPVSEDAGYTSACDMWSLGVLTYVTLSGKTPFWERDGNQAEMVDMMRAEFYQMQKGVWEGISGHAKDFIRSLLKADPEARCPPERLLLHPWLAKPFVRVDPHTFHDILSNLEHFSHAPHFLSICVASVVKQLDHRSLDDIYEVFAKLDADGDGSLTKDEIQAGFQEAFGRDSELMAEVDEMFARLDFDGTGRISYTEFCAAGIGERSYTQEHVLWAAFKIFDIHDDNKITREELQQVLSKADVKEIWSGSVCEEVAKEVMEDFGGEDGSINFGEWLQLMRLCASRHSEETPKRLPSKATGDHPERNTSKELADGAGGGDHLLPGRNLQL